MALNPRKNEAQADPRQLQGTQRVVALLLAMGKPLAERLLPHFEPSEIKRISQTVTELGPLQAAELESLIEDFTGQFSAGLSPLVSAREMESLLTGAIPSEQIAGMMSNTPTESDDPIWESVSRLSESVLAGYLLKEHPQTIALVLSKIQPGAAAKVMTQFPPKLRDEMMRRMLSSKPAMEASLRIVASTLHEDLLLNFARSTGADTHERLAKIINKMNRDDMEGVLQNLGAARPKSAEILKGLLFTFDDLINLTPHARTTLFDQIPSERLVLALKGTDEEFREVILSALASRARRVVENELAQGEPASQRDVTEARRQIADLALEMSGRGEIELNSSEEEDAIY